MIYPRRPTYAQELYDEMLQQDPELANILPRPPRMFRPAVAMLTFSPFASIPHQVFVFGAWLRLWSIRIASNGHKNIQGSVSRGGHFNGAGKGSVEEGDEISVRASS